LLVNLHEKLISHKPIFEGRKF